jgi:hypothetical protein
VFVISKVFKEKDNEIDEITAADINDFIIQVDLY